MDIRYEDVSTSIIDACDISKTESFIQASEWGFHQLAQCNPTAAEEWLSKIDSLLWNNYITRQAAESSVMGMYSKDSYNPTKWTKDDIDTLSEGIVDTERFPFYNYWAFYMTANLLATDHLRTLRSLCSESIAIEAILRMTEDKLTDPDNPYFVRKYLNL